MGDGAYWFDNTSGNFVSSTYYFQDLPPWVKDFNGSRPADQFKGVQWLRIQLPPESSPRLYGALAASPFGNELIESFVERAVQAEQLGQRDTTDLLAGSLSSNDYIGHALG